MQNFNKKKIMDLQWQVMSNCVNAKKKTFQRGEYILSFGLHQKMIGLILSGNVDIIRTDIEGNETVIRKLYPGNMFNDAFASFSLDSVFIISRTKSEIYFTDYIQIFNNFPLKCKYNQQMIYFLLNEKIEVLSYPKIKDRILAFLSLSLENSNDTTITLPCSLTELAMHLCVNRSAFMRELKKMEQEGILLRQGKKITLLNASRY